VSTSFQEAVESVARRRNISEDEAALIVAEEYGAVAHVEEAPADEAMLDEPDDAELWLRDHRPEGRTVRVPIDDERSPAALVHATETVAAAKAEGDRYRALSRNYTA
jgi:hypothetical protein